MATSIVAYGTVKKYALRGLAMPEGWFVNAETGAPITDPNRTGRRPAAADGRIQGRGLALMLGLLGGVLNGAAFGRDVVDFNADDASETNTGHFMVAIDIARFMPLATFTAEVDRHVRDLRAFEAVARRRRDPPAGRPPRRNAAPNACATACRSRRRCLAQLDKLAAELKIKPLRER